jgi:hypothetical protein
MPSSLKGDNLMFLIGNDFSTLIIATNKFYYMTKYFFYLIVWKHKIFFLIELWILSKPPEEPLERYINLTRL